MSSSNLDAEDTPAEEAAYLIAVGKLGELDSNKIDAYLTFWYTDSVAAPLLHPDARSLREDGYSMAHTLDAMRHNLTGDQAPFAYNNGFNAHQAHLIEHTPQAVRNLWKQEADEIANFVESEAPRAYLLNVLLIAKSPNEALDLRQRWETGTPADQEELERDVAVLAGLEGDLPVIPNCCPTGRALTAP